MKTLSLYNLALWAAQILLSAGLLWAAAMKLFQPIEILAQMWPWTAENVELVKLTGILDLLAGVGIVLPRALNFRPKLTVWAAFGVIALMIAASIFHISRGESNLIGVNIFFATIAAFVGWGRSKSGV